MSVGSTKWELPDSLENIKKLRLVVEEVPAVPYLARSLPLLDVYVCAHPGL